MQIIEKEVEVSGRKIRIETGKLAKQADGAAVVSCEGTSVLATAVASDDVRNIDFLPLTVDVEEKLYAAGKIPGSFFRREGRPTEGATLTARIIDRSIRPNFDKRFRNETQVVITVLSTDQVNPPDMLGIVGASAALAISDIPFEGTLAGVRVGRIEGDWVINPTYEQMAQSQMNLVVTGNSESIVMVEAGAEEVSEDEMVEALGVGHEAVRSLINAIGELDEEVRRTAGRKPKDQVLGDVRSFLEPRFANAVDDLMDAYRQADGLLVEEKLADYRAVGDKAASEFTGEFRKLVSILSRIIGDRTLGERLSAEIEPQVREQMAKALVDASVPGLSKAQRSLMRKDSRKGLAAIHTEKYAGVEGHVKEIFEGLERTLIREQILNTGVRPDGRKSFQIRKLSCEVGLLPKTHGSALFTRGETQVLSISTLGAHGEKQILDDLGTEEYKSFLHHYNFPPFSSGEARPIRGPRRREIGHGALVEKAILPLIPDEADFPYTIRLVSEVLESNGSTSMASVCASSMSLMDAGVPLKGGSAISGIAMGLVLGDEGHVILSDIQGLEDAVGDMDFKVAGTRNGITALQMDIKCSGISGEVMKASLAQAREGRQFILKAMNEAISEPRGEVSPNAPRMLQLSIPVDKIGDLIGPGGKNIRGLQEAYDVDIDVENDGKVFVFGRNRDNVESVRRSIERIAKDPEVGDQFLGTVVKTTTFGAFVELVPGRDGLVHISKLSKGRIDKVEDVVNVGDKISVEIEEVDNLGRINLKVLDLEP